MPRLLVLDMDDTLYLESEYVKSGFTAAAGTIYNKPRSSAFLEAALLRFRQGNRGNIFNLALEDCGIVPEKKLVEELVNAYREHHPNIRMCQDAEYFFQNLRDDLKTALVSDGYLPPQQRKAEALGLYERLDKIVLTESLGREFWKPNPKAFEILEQHFDIHGEDCTYIGDNPSKDFDGPKKLNWKTVRIRRPGALHATMLNKPGCIADKEITSLEQLAEFIAI